MHYEWRERRLAERAERERLADRLIIILYIKKKRETVADGAPQIARHG